MAWRWVKRVCRLTMSVKFQKVAVVGRHDDSRVAEPMALLVKHLTKAGVEVVAAEDMALDLPVKRVSKSELANHADLVIAIGGDGTMLYAGGIVRDADVTPEDMIASVDHVLGGEYTIEARLLLDANLTMVDGQTVSATAFNDVVLQRHGTGHMVDFEASVAGQFVNTHSGDGLIVATPTGSTAYALSCGGPIIEPQLDAVVIVIVIAAGQEIEIRLLEREDTRADISVDGHSLGPIHSEGRLTINASNKRIRLIHPPGYDFYGILRSKLLWGRDNRTRTNTAR